LAVLVVLGGVREGGEAFACGDERVVRLWLAVWHVFEVAPICYLLVIISMIFADLRQHLPRT
jgi:hypothetical protein